MVVPNIEIYPQVIIIGIAIDMLLFMFLGAFSCGGRSHCGMSLCPVGLYDDHPLLISILVPFTLCLTVYIGGVVFGI